MTTPTPSGSGRRPIVMAAAAAVMAIGGVVAISSGMQVSEQAPRPPAEAFGSVEPERALSLPGQKFESGQKTAVIAQTDSHEVPSSPPITIDIPVIGAHSDLQFLGLDPTGAVEVPTYPRYHEAGWYKHSSEPGSPGPAVILGHVDSVEGGRSIFFHLGDLRPGDEILVTRLDGLIAVFVVDGVRSYPKDQFPTFLVYGPTERSALRLITCGGRWNSAAHSFEENIVVFASLAEFRETPRRATIG